MARSDKTQIGRLALRVEGDNWNAYYALADTMDGAIFLGSIRIGAVTGNPSRRQAFMDLMTGLVGDFLQDQFGSQPTWTIQAAPEIERSGSA